MSRISFNMNHSNGMCYYFVDKCVELFSALVSFRYDFWNAFGKYII